MSPPPQAAYLGSPFLLETQNSQKGHNNLPLAKLTHAATTIGTGSYPESFIPFAKMESQVASYARATVPSNVFSRPRSSAAPYYAPPRRNGRLQPSSLLGQSLRAMSRSSLRSSRAAGRAAVITKCEIGDRCMGEALRTISFKVRTASCGGTACVNSFGDEQLAVDMLADKLLFEALRYSHFCKYACSEELPELQDMGGPVEESATISVVVRPLFEKSEMSVLRSDVGEGMSLLAELRLAVVESLLPNCTFHEVPPIWEKKRIASSNGKDVGTRNSLLADCLNVRFDCINHIEAPERICIEECCLLSGKVRSVVEQDRAVTSLHFMLNRNIVQIVGEE